MKGFIFIILFAVLPMFAFSQVDGMDGYNNQGNNGFNNGFNNGMKKDSANGGEDLLHTRLRWQWMHDGVYKNLFLQDTAFESTHNFNYIFQKSISNTYLANFPSPYESNIFIQREGSIDYHVLKNIRAYLFRPDDAINFSCTTPYTQLIYYTGGGKTKNETHLDIWHNQNINPWWNAGFRYDLIVSDGRYMNQKSKVYNFSLFSNYERKRHVVQFFLNQNNGYFNENGGINDRSVIRDTTEKAENILVNLNEGVKNSFRNFNFYTQYQYNFGNKKVLNLKIKETEAPKTHPQDSTNDVQSDSIKKVEYEHMNEEDEIYIYPAKFVASILIEDNEHKFTEIAADSIFFRQTYHLMRDGGTYDKDRNRDYHLSAKFVMNEHPRLKYLPGLYAGLDYIIQRYQNLVFTDSSQYYIKRQRANTWLNAGIFNLDTAAFLNYDFNLKLAMIGDYAGDVDARGFIKSFFNKAHSSYFQADAKFLIEHPNEFYTSFSGNHNKWTNDFKTQKTIDIQARYINTRIGTEVGAAYTNVFQYIHIDSLARPVQESQTITLLTAWLKQKIRLGKFHFNQTAYLQHTSQDNILQLPLLSLYSNNYYENWLFKKALWLQLGVDLFYNTSFYADNYMPSIMQFYDQRIEKTGNYPKLDVFANLGIKRCIIFVKYEHASYYIANRNYFSALDYPINPPMFKFGFRWRFYN